MVVRGPPYFCGAVGGDAVPGLDVDELVEEGAVDELGLTEPVVLLDPVDEGGLTEPEAPVVVSAPAVELGAEVVAEALAVPPVFAPDHQSLDARLLGEAFR